MLWNGGYIQRPQIAFVISCHMLLQIKFHASVFYGIDIIVFGSTSLCDICYLQIIHMLRRNNSY